MHDLGRAVGPARVHVRPRRLHVGLVVEPLEAAERVARLHLVVRGIDARLRHGIRAEAEERIEQRDERVVAPGERDPPRHVVREAERVVVRRALVERRVAQDAGALVERGAPSPREPPTLLGDAAVAHVVGDSRRAPVGERDVERVADRLGAPAREEVLSVGAAQIGQHVDEGGVPVDAGRARRAHVGEQGVREPRRLAREAVGSLRHAVPDGEIALLLADPHEGGRELGGAVGVQQAEKRQLRAVDVPHRADVERVRAARRPLRALVGGERGLDERVV